MEAPQKPATARYEKEGKSNQPAAAHACNPSHPEG
jgi:hypothetical protein